MERAVEMVSATAALMIVGLLKVRRKEAGDGRSGQDDDRGGRSKVLRDEHADVIGESVRAVAAELMEAEVSALIGAERGERRPEDRDASQRVSAQALGHAGR